MKLEEIRDGLRCGNMVKPKKTFWVITIGENDSMIYYISEGMDFQGVWSKTIKHATKFTKANLPRTISSGQAVFSPKTVVATEKYGDGLAYVVKAGNIPSVFAIAFPFATRDY